MANKTSLKLIEACAESNYLQSAHAQASRKWLQRPIQRSLQIIEALEMHEQPMYYDELAELTGLHWQTAYATVQALIRGGYPVETVPAPEGRADSVPAVMVRLKKVGEHKG